jgi:sulfide:quinone oxidoreductase
VQSRVVKANLLAAMNNKALPDQYDGYASCPLVVGVDKLILAEFSAYTGQVSFYPNRAAACWFSC